eukprot:scaffold369_cov177-Ochromonas_danica.AAC.64
MFDLVPTEAEEILSSAPSSVSPVKRRANVNNHTPFPDAAIRPSLNKSPETPQSMLWANQSSCSSVQSASVMTRERSVMNVNRSMETVNLTTVSIAQQQTPIPHQQQQVNSPLSFMLPNYTPPSAGSSIVGSDHQSIARESQMPTPIMQMPHAPTTPSVAIYSPYPAHSYSTNNNGAVSNMHQNVLIAQVSPAASSPAVSPMTENVFKSMMASPIQPSPSNAISAVMNGSSSANVSNTLSPAMQQQLVPSPHNLPSRLSSPSFVVASATSSPIVHPDNSMQQQYSHQSTPQQQQAAVLSMSQQFQQQYVQQQQHPQNQQQASFHSGSPSLSEATTLSQQASPLELHKAQQPTPITLGQPVGLPQLGQQRSPNAPEVAPVAVTLQTQTPYHQRPNALVGQDVQTPVASQVNQNLLDMNLASPVVLAINGGVALGRGPTVGVSSKPPLPRHSSIAAAVSQASIQPLVHAITEEGKPAKVKPPVGIAAALSPPAKGQAWNTPRNSRKLPLATAMTKKTEKTTTAAVPAQAPSPAARAAAAAVRLVTQSVEEESVAEDDEASAVEEEATAHSLQKEVEEDKNDYTQQEDKCNVSIQVDPQFFKKVHKRNGKSVMDCAVNTSFASEISQDFSQQSRQSSSHSRRKQSSSLYASSSTAVASVKHRSSSSSSRRSLAEISPISNTMMMASDVEDNESHGDDGSLASTTTASTTCCLEELLMAANHHADYNNIIHNKSASTQNQGVTGSGSKMGIAFNSRACSIPDQSPSNFSVSRTTSRPPLTTDSLRQSSNMLNQSQSSVRSALLGSAVRILTPNKEAYIEEQWNNACAEHVAEQEDLEQEEEEDMSSVTLNKSQFPTQQQSLLAAAEVTILTDVAVANYTLDMIEQNNVQYVEEEAVAVIAPNSPVPTSNAMMNPSPRQQHSPCFDQSMMTTADQTVFLDVTSGTSPSQAYPKLAVKTLKRVVSPKSADKVGSGNTHTETNSVQSSAGFDIKEVVLQAAPGEVTTVMLTFANHRSKNITMTFQTVSVRFDSYNMSNSQGSTVANNCFSVSPNKITIAADQEEVIFITFTPANGSEGIYTGAMQIRQGKKKFTMLLRGEAFKQYSVTPAPPEATIEEEVQQSNKAGHVQPPSPVHAVNLNSSPIVKSEGTEKSGFSNKLRALHEKVAEISRSVLWHDQSCASPVAPSHSTVPILPPQSTPRRDLKQTKQQPPVLQQLGISSSPCSFTVTKPDSSYPTQSGSRWLIKGAFSLRSTYARPKVVRCRVSQNLFMLSTNLVILYPNQEQHVGLSLLPGQEGALVSFLTTLLSQNKKAKGEDDISMAEITVQFDDQKLLVPVTITKRDIELLLTIQQRSGQQQQGSNTTFMTNRQQHEMTFTRQNISHLPQQQSMMNPSSSSSSSTSALYFRRKELDFGTAKVKDLLRAKIELCNGSNQEVTVYLGDPQLPFMLGHSQVNIRPRTFVRLPVRYLPVQAGRHQRDLIAQTADGSAMAVVTLIGQATL